jgi:hypothetical protein
LERVGDNSKVLLAFDIEENRNGDNITPKQAEDFVARAQKYNRLPLI